MSTITITLGDIGLIKYINVNNCVFIERSDLNHYDPTLLFA